MPSDFPSSDFSYEHRPKPFSNPLTLTLKGAVLQAERGSKTQEFALTGIESMKLAYRPANTARGGFVCTLRAKDARTLTFTNLDWRSMVENKKLDPEYSAFVRALAARLARINPAARLETGIASWRRALFFYAAALIGPMLVLAAFYFARSGSWPLGALTLGLVAWFGLYAREYLRRNRPGTFRPEAIPSDVLPDA